MHDEACPIYEDMIENMMLGHRFIKDNFGVKPRVGWQIDPFGHSNTNARLFAEMGFDSLFFARLDYQDKEKRLNDKELEFVWRPVNNSLGPQTQILTHVLYQHYSAPRGFDFEISSNDPSWINNASYNSNAKEEAAALMKQLDDRAKHYMTDEIMVLFGDDFHYMDAENNYRSLDNMIAYMNEHHSENYTFFYSTPSQYTDAIAKHNVSWPTKYDDMFPYSDHPNAYWTGYFTSRANHKSYIRTASYNFHASNQIYA